MYEIYDINIPGAPKRTEEPRLKKIHPPLPRPHAGDAFRMMLIGPSGSGKSNFFLNMITRGDMYGSNKEHDGVFDRVYIFCPTFYNDRTLRKLTTPGKNGETYMDKEDIFTFGTAKEIKDKLEELTKEIESDLLKHTNNEDAPPKTLMVFDDLTNQIANATFMKDLFSKGRKNEISLIIMTNKYKTYDPQIRANATHYGVFRVTTAQELESIADDVNGYEDAARAALKYATEQKKEDHPFVFIDKTAAPNEMLWYKLSTKMLPKQ